MADKSNDPTDSPGVIGQMSRLRAHSGATAAELREFVKQLRGRTPQEVIGVIAQSNLIRATAMAAGGTFIILIVFTILPILFGGSKAKPEAAAPAAPTAPVAEKPAAAKTDDSSKAVVPPVTAKTKDQEAADKLGIGETKTLDPKKNPLEGAGDDLFKDIK